MKYLLFIACLLFVKDTFGQLQTQRYEEFTFCKAHLKTARAFTDIRIDSIQSKDSVYYNWYYGPAFGMFQSEDFIRLINFNDRYFLVLDGIVHRADKFLDLSMSSGSSIQMDGGYFGRQSVSIILRNKLYSTALNDSLYFYEIEGDEPSSHRLYLNNFVFSKKYGFLRYGYRTPLIRTPWVEEEPEKKLPDGCFVFYLPDGFYKKWKRTKDSCLRKLFLF